MYFKTQSKENFGMTNIGGGGGLAPTPAPSSKSDTNTMWYVAAGIVGLLVVGGLIYSLKHKTTTPQ